MANACNPCPCGEMEGVCEGCRVTMEDVLSAGQCRHGDTASLCLLCRTSPLKKAKEKPQVNSFEFSLWLQTQNTEALAEWIAMQTASDAADDH